MHALESFQENEGYACYRPEKRGCLDDAINLVGAAIAFARENRIKRLLVDTRKLTGFETIATWERFFMAVRFAAEAMSGVEVAVVARPELIDPQRFGVIVARNRGMRTDAFDSEIDALAWLLNDVKSR
jgi:hypothetical protein